MLVALSLIAAAMWLVSGLVLRTQSETEVSARRFRGLMESAPDAMVIVNQAGTIVKVNDQAVKTFGYPEEAMVGQSVNMLVPQRGRSAHSEQIAGYFENPERRAEISRRFATLREDLALGADDRAAEAIIALAT